jgi:hypothetical protein
MKTKTTGKIQLIVGILFLIIILMGGILTFKIVYSENLGKNLEAMAEATNNLKQLNSTDIYGVELVNFVAYMLIEKSIFFTTGALFIINMLIAVILSTILILQGIDKTRK